MDDSSTSKEVPADANVASSSDKSPDSKLPEKQRWADVVDDEEEEAKAVSVLETEIKVGALSLERDNKTPSLEEPEDTSIRAVTSGDTPYTSAKTFEDLKLTPELLKGLYVEMHFERPSKIQAVSLPMILTPPFKDLVAQAHNGSGKTTCFVLGMLSRVDPKVLAPQALCVCPTRELAIQNLEVLQKMAKYTGITSECAIPMDSASRLPTHKRPPVLSQVVVGTPGTINRLFQTKKLSATHMKILVFDEADHMLADDGFKDDSLRIINTIKASHHCQILLFSATFNETVKSFVSRVVNDYNQMFVKKEELSLEGVKQFKVNCRDEEAKISVIKDKILELGQKVGQTIIFVRKKVTAVYLHKALKQYGWSVTNIQGDIQQEDRDKIVKEFRDGLTQVLISTDLLARGFDQSQVNLVVNFNLPEKFRSSEPDYEVYLHRIGRAGRFGRKGAVFNLICDDEKPTMAKIEKHFAVQIPEVDQGNDRAFEEALNQAGLM